MKIKSPKYSLSGTGTKLLKSLLFCFLGAFATWVLQLTDIVDFGVYAPFVGALVPLIANTIIQFIKETK